MSRPTIAKISFLSSILLSSVLSSSALANIIGNDTANFNPNPDGVDFVTVHSSETLQPGILNTGVFFNRARNTLPQTLLANGTPVDPNDEVTFMDIGVAYGFTRHFEMGVAFSTLLDQKIDANSPGAQFAATGLNDIRFLAKYQFLDREKSPVGLAIVPSVDINQTQNNPFTGNGNAPTLNLEGVMDAQVYGVHMAGNLGYRKRSPGGALTGALYRPLPDQWVASGALSYYFPSLDLKLIAEGFLAKAMADVGQVSERSISTEFLLGVKYDWTTRIASHLGFGSRLSDGLFTPEWRVYLGLNISLDVFKIGGAYQNRTPEPVAAAAVAKPVVRRRTRPAAQAAAPIVVKQYYQGYLPEDIEQLKDVDFDEIARTHEFQLRTDVPEEDITAQKPPFEIIRLGGFEFDFASDEIRDENVDLLNKLARYLNERPAVIKVRVEGHTDSIGSEDRQKGLSMRRAVSVINFLKAAGALGDIEFQPVGYGADRPIGDNGNYQGRQKNRRVEIRILRRLEDAPVRVK